MANVVITTDTAEVFSHDVYLAFTLQDSTADTHSARLFDFGKIKYEFDIPDEGTETSVVGLKSGSLKVTLENIFIDSSDTLIDTFKSSYNFDITQTWSAQFYWRETGGTYGNPIELEFTYSDIDYDYEDDLVKLELNPILTTDITVADVISGSSSFVYDFQTEPGITGGDALLAKAYIDDCLTDLYGDSTAIETLLVDSAASGDIEWFVVSRTTSSLSMLGLLATFEGAIFGSGLGKGFYVQRGNTDNTVNVDWNDVTKYKRKQFYDTPYKKVQVNIAIGDITETKFSDYYKNAEKDINISFDGDGFFLGDIQDPAPDLSIPVNYEQPRNDIILEGVNNYGLAFGFSGAETLEIEVWGINVFPYNVINFTNAPSFLSGNFRIKEIEYDFKTDSFKANIYEI